MFILPFLKCLKNVPKMLFKLAAKIIPASREFVEKCVLAILEAKISAFCFSSQTNAYLRQVLRLWRSVFSFSVFIPLMEFRKKKSHRIYTNPNLLLQFHPSEVARYYNLVRSFKAFALKFVFLSNFYFTIGVFHSKSRKPVVYQRRALTSWSCSVVGTYIHCFFFLLGVKDK